MVTEEGKSTLLAFYSLFETSNKDGRIGAVLVTDHFGVPQEFRCSHPVKPTAIQRQLYGNSLEPYLGIQLCGIPLVQSLKLRPSLIIVNREYLLSLRQDSPYPVIFLHRAGETIELESLDAAEDAKKRVRIESPSKRFQPLIIVAQASYEEDRDRAREIIEPIFSHLDLYEPFERMHKAVEVLGKQDSRFQ